MNDPEMARWLEATKGAGGTYDYTRYFWVDEYGVLGGHSPDCSPEGGTWKKLGTPQGVGHA